MTIRAFLGLTASICAAPLAAQAPASADAAAWLSGCWVMRRGTAIVEEQWMAPAGGVMLGMGRTVKAGVVQDYELMIIRARDGRVDYEAHPMQQAASTFTATVVSDTLLQFENPQHDFPRVVSYRRQGADSMVARIAASPAPGGKQVLFPYQRVACPGAPPAHH